MTNYQPLFIKGKEYGDYQRACAPRYEPIKEALEKRYSRCISVLDLGANFGYFGTRLAYDMGCVSVLVDTKPLHRVLEGNAPSTTIWLNARLGADHLRRLARSESFDVVLALNVVHHIPDWKGAVDALLEMGETVIFELPGKGDKGTANYEICDSLREYVLSKPHELLLEMPSHVSGVKRPMVLLEGQNTITQQTIDAEERGCQPVEVKIFSTRTGKAVRVVHKRTTEMRGFIHGMNLWNFHLLNGAWPVNIGPMIKEGLRGINRFHDDLRPWNFIIDGLKCHPIDYADKLWRSRPEEGGLEKCLKLLSMKPDYNDPEFRALLKTA